MNVNDVIWQFMKPVPAVVTSTSRLFEAAALMGERGIRHLPVVGDDHRVVGVLSDRDVRATLGDPRHFLSDPTTRERFREISVARAMSTPAITVRADAPITTAIDHLLHDKVGTLPVVDDEGRILGTLSYLDVLQAVRDGL